MGVPERRDARGNRLAPVAVAPAPVDDGPFRGHPEQPGLGVALLRFGRDRSHLNETEAKAKHGLHDLRILVVPSRKADWIRELFSPHCRAQNSRRGPCVHGHKHPPTPLRQPDALVVRRVWIHGAEYWHGYGGEVEVRLYPVAAVASGDAQHETNHRAGTDGQEAFEKPPHRIALVATGALTIPPPMPIGRTSPLATIRAAAALFRGRGRGRGRGGGGGGGVIPVRILFC